MLALLLLAPAGLYGIVMALSVRPDNVIEFGRLDLAVLVMVLTYFAVVSISLATWSRLAISKLVMAVYFVLATIAIAEIPLRQLYPPTAPAVPWVPGRRVATAGDAMPGITGTIEFTVNSLGLRGPEVNLSDVDTRILAVGGSTTECLYVTDKRSWPWLLQERLARSLNRSVFVGNAGKSGLFTIHHDYLLKNYPLANRFEWVIVMAGINDLGSLLRGSYDSRRTTVAEETLTPTYRSKAYYRRLTPVRVLERLVTLSRVGETVVQDPQGDWYDLARKQRQARLRQREIREAPADFDRALALYATNLQTIIDTSRKNGQQLVLVTQPTLYRKDLPENLQQLLHESVADGAHTVEVMAEMMDAFNRTLIDVSRESRVDYIDLASMLPKDTSTFYDDAHFNDSGSDKVATAIAGFMASRISGKLRGN
jgi:lysophospholipase L1-like esterase